MKSSTRVVLVVVVGTAIGMLLDTHGPLGSLVYPPHAGGPVPSGLQLPSAVLVTLGQAVAFGVGLALLVDRRRVLDALARAAGGRHGTALAAYAGLVWTLMSWIPHVSLHQHIDPRNLWALLGIEVVFHLGVILSAVLLVRVLYVGSSPAAVAKHAASPRASPRDA